MTERTTTDLIEEIEGQHGMSPGLLTERLLHGFAGHPLEAFTGEDLEAVRDTIDGVLAKAGPFPERPEAVEMAEMLREVREVLEGVELSEEARDFIRQHCTC